MKKKVAVLYGGISAEHDVSLVSGQAVIDHLDQDLFEVIPVLISKDGQFDEEKVRSADIVFPVLHGVGGEDGSIQGYCEEVDLPYVGSGIEASSLALDKIASKEIWQSQKLPIPSFSYFEKHDWLKNQEKIINSIPLPAFIKPFNTGSSLGIYKVKEKVEIIPAVAEALKIADKIIVEESIEDMREIEVGVVGNDDLIISNPGEVIPSEEFYTFNAKYKGQSKIIIPAEISEEKKQEIKNLVAKAYQTLDCQGFSRVDLFMKKDTGEIYLNEINTIPGFTEISMFPKLMETVGLTYKNLLTKIIDLGSKNEK